MGSSFFTRLLLFLMLDQIANDIFNNYIIQEKANFHSWLGIEFIFML